MVGLRIYDEEFNRIMLRSIAGKKMRIVSVSPDQVVPGKQFMDSGNLFEVLPTSDKTGFFAASKLVSAGEEWSVEPH